MTDDPDFQLELGASVQKSPTGQVWVVLHVYTPLINTATLLPIDVAEKVAVDLPAILEKTVREAKREARGLVIAKDLPAERKPS